jgi:hypothetical protein
MSFMKGRGFGNEALREQRSENRENGEVAGAKPGEIRYEIFKE